MLSFDKLIFVYRTNFDILIYGTKLLTGSVSKQIIIDMRNSSFDIINRSGVNAGRLSSMLKEQ